jgi:hypothetical protein
LSSRIISKKLEMYGSGDVARGEYDNTEVEPIRGNFAR